MQYSDGVLNVELTNGHHFVLNKQTPNKQIWLSSPISGPQRFDYHAGAWLQVRTNEDLLQLLASEWNRDNKGLELKL